MEDNFKPFEFSKIGDEKTAVAVEYVPGEAAPKILATGKGQVAEKIIQTAKDNNVPLYKDNKLAGTLSKLKIIESFESMNYNGFEKVKIIKF